MGEKKEIWLMEGSAAEKLIAPLRQNYHLRSLSGSSQSDASGERARLTAGAQKEDESLAHDEQRRDAHDGQHADDQARKQPHVVPQLRQREVHGAR